MTDQIMCEKCGYPLAEVDDGEGWGHYECKFCEMQNTLDRVLAAGSMYEYQVDHLKMAVMNGRKEIKRLREKLIGLKTWTPASAPPPPSKDCPSVSDQVLGKGKNERGNTRYEVVQFLHLVGIWSSSHIKVEAWQPLPPLEVKG